MTSFLTVLIIGSIVAIFVLPTVTYLVIKMGVLGYLKAKRLDQNSLKGEGTNAKE